MDKRRLGRGLDALLGHPDGESADGVDPGCVPLERIDHNPYQPRKDFDAEDLASLRRSIETHGILQPVVVRSAGDRFQLVAGERRLRAAQAAGIREIPVRVVDFDDQQVLEAALAENIHRSDLNPIEKAQGFKDYLQRFGMTQEQLAARLGLDRSTISNLVNLLELPALVQEALRLEQITVGHAKVLKGLSDPEQQAALCQQIIGQGLSVRATETLVREQRDEPEAPERKPGVRKTAHVQALEDELRKKLATRVEIRLREKHRGQIVIAFECNDDFERVIEQLRGRVR